MPAKKLKTKYFQCIKLYNSINSEIAPLPATENQRAGLANPLLTNAFRELAVAILDSRATSEQSLSYPTLIIKNACERLQFALEYQSTSVSEIDHLSEILSLNFILYVQSFSEGKI